MQVGIVFTYYYSNIPASLSYSVSEMCVTNNIFTFDGLMRNNIKDFTMLRVDSSYNILISTTRDNGFVHAGHLRQKWIKSVHTVYN